MNSASKYLEPKDITELLTLGPMPAVKNPYPIYKKLRDEMPVLDNSKANVEASISGNPYSVFITRYDDIKNVLKDDVTFSSAITNRTMGLVMGPTIVGMDGKEHMKHRALITPSMTARTLKGGSFPDEVRKIAHSHIDKFIKDGKADLHDQFCFDYPISVFVSILGLDVADVGQVHRWGQDLCLVAFDPMKGIVASEALLNYLTPIVQEKRKHPGDDMISTLVQSEVDGQKLTDLEVVSFLRLLTLAGAETTNHLIGTAFYVMLKDPALMERVRNDRKLVSALMNECMRWEPPVSTVMREATCDTTIGGVPIKKNTAVVCQLGSANRDERRFKNPDVFDIDRPDNDPIPFGYGRHYCAGSHLAKLEGEIGINALLDRLKDVKIQPGVDFGVIGFSFRGPDHLPVTFTPA
jgi:cytochrome P450